MSIAPRPGMLRFDGDVAVFYMAICQQCDIALPHPSEMAREMWATAHPHTVTYALDVRPDVGVTERRRYVLVSRLREKHSAPMPAIQGGVCAGKGKTCDGEVAYQQRYVQWNGKLWHAECLDDLAYLRMADVTDIAPGIFDDVKPVTVHRWMSEYGNGPAPSSNPLGRHANFVAALGVDLKKIIAADVADDTVKKPNARERRRQRREGKQWRRGS